LRFDKSKGNDKVQNPNFKRMSKLEIQNIWHWGFGFDLAFELGILAFGIQDQTRTVAGAATLITREILA
jgi:hypothetical protein